jgi:hypothetical protein
MRPASAPFAALVAAAALSFAAPQAAEAAFAPGPAGEALTDAAPLVTGPVWHRGRPHRGRVVCTIRYRRFFNGLFWNTAPVRVCWRRW